MFLLLFLFVSLKCSTVDLSGQWALEAVIPNNLKSSVLDIITDPAAVSEIQRTGYLRCNGTVPGYIVWDLYQNHIISHPLHSDNDVKLRPLAFLAWTYSKTLKLSDDISFSDPIKLVFDGVDTVANIFLNKQFVVSTNNMFIGDMSLDIKDFITPDREVFIQVEILSAITTAETSAKSYPHLVPPIEYPAVQNGEKYRNFVRKSPASFSWDWAPAFAAQGIWRGVRVEYGQEFKFKSSRISTSLINDFTWHFKAVIVVGYDGQMPSVSPFIIDTNPTNIQTVINVIGGDLEVVFSCHVSHISPWFPVGYGKPTLYQFQVDICNLQYPKNCQSLVKAFGFREVYLNQSFLDDGLEIGNFFSDGELSEKKSVFEFVINNVPVYVKGANIVPLSVFETDLTQVERIFDVIELGNINTLRVWGGGVYHSDKFYDEADRRGIMIWQEFMFACSLYPTDQNFLNSVSSEVFYQVNRLRSHPSVILFSGNNENKQALQQNWYNTSHEKIFYVSEYQKLYDHTIRSIVEEQSDLPFLLSSPSNGENSGWIDDDPQSQLAGDVHFYNYSANCLDTSNFPVPRFASEFGFQSYPSLHTLKEALPGVKSLSLFSDALQHRQHLVNGNILLLEQITRMFDAVEELENEALVYMSQLHQYLCVTAQINHYRRYLGVLTEDHRGYNSGVMFWQLNDVWAAPTWSAVDVTGRAKMLMYGVRDAYQPITMSSTYNGSHILIYSVNERSEIESCDLDVFLHHLTWMKSLREWSVSGSCSPRISTLLLTVASSDVTHLCKDISRCFLSIEFRSGDVRMKSIAPFGYDWKGLKPLDPEIEISQVEKTDVSVVYKITALRPALFVWLEGEEDGTYSENMFTMLQPEMFVRFTPIEMGKRCCDVRITSLYHYVMKQTE